MHLKKMGMISGVPDICILYQSQSKKSGYIEPKTLFIELKTRTGKLSDNQKIIIPKIELTGHSVEIARSLDDVIEILVKYGVLI